MFANIETGYKKLRRSISRGEWMIRLLGLKPVATATDSEDQGHPTGLIMIQIDGLARAQFDAALEKGELPFLKRLLTREHFQCHTMYSGLPSSTPGVQGELFYGVKGIVPAFGYRRKEDGEHVRMYDPAAAHKVQDTLDALGAPLLEGGSAYCNIYTGGASESHFCAASSGWDDLIKGITPLKWLMILTLNLPTLLRTVATMVIEFFLAVVDVVRGVVAGRSFFPELKFIVARVFVSILLRDMVTIGASMDIARGAPVIHLNYLGYDEQSHRRGPSSAFAHWTLKGIDRCIEKLWNVSHRYHKRHYDIWVYSDHGQEHTIPYQRLTGRSIDESVRTAMEETRTDSATVQYADNPGIETSTFDGRGGERAKYLGGKKAHLSSTPDNSPSDSTAKTTTPMVVAMGPVGHIYFDSSVNQNQKLRIAKTLVKKHQVPAAITIADDCSLLAITAQGEYRLPEQEDKLFGDDHPFLSVLSDDLQRLSGHEDAGDIVLLGCVHGATAISFPMENGSHAGAGPNETRAFAMVPGDTLLHRENNDFIRPHDLYKTAMAVLGRENHDVPETQTALQPTKLRSTGKVVNGVSNRELVSEEANSGGEMTKPFRLMTYNVHRCVGMDNIESPERIARVISRSRPDVIALQELDVSKSRTDRIHQAMHIAKLLDMKFHFHPARVAENELYGDAILSSLPMKFKKADSLPQPAGNATSEIRGALWVEIEHQGSKIQLINTHLGLRSRERRVQMNELTSQRWLAHPECNGPVIMCGDFNALPGSKPLQQLGTVLQDVRENCTVARTAKTFSSRLPIIQIDHIFANEQLTPVSIVVPDSELTRVASDHLPLLAELMVSKKHPAMMQYRQC